MAEKNVKYYNPYPFPIKMINDLGKEQVLAPQGRGKVPKNRYTQSALTLPLWNADEKVFKTGLDLDLDKMLKNDLIDLAWTLMIGKKKIFEDMTKKQIMQTIREKVGVEETNVEQKDRETEIDPSLENSRLPEKTKDDETEETESEDSEEVFMEDPVTDNEERELLE